MQNNFHHLHQSGDNQYEDDGYHKCQAVRYQQLIIDQVGGNGRNCHNEHNGKPHAQSRGNLFRDAEERTDSQELRQNNVIYKDCGNKNHYITHLIFSAAS